MEVKYNKGSIFSVIDLLFPKESLLEVELEKELIACNEWNLRQKNEPAETRAPAYEDMYQYDCYTCGYSHHHSPPEVTMLWLCLYYHIFIPNFSLPSKIILFCYFCAFFLVNDCWASGIRVLWPFSSQHEKGEVKQFANSPSLLLDFESFTIEYVQSLSIALIRCMSQI